MVNTLKRLFWLALLSGAGFAGWALWDSTRRKSAGEPAVVSPGSTANVVVEPVGTIEPAPQGFAGVPAVEALWVEPVDGVCPASHPVKANDNSGIYHLPRGRFYERTRPERCYATPEGAEADGYRAAKS